MRYKVDIHKILTRAGSSELAAAKYLEMIDWVEEHVSFDNVEFSIPIPFLVTQYGYALEDIPMFVMFENENDALQFRLSF